MSSSDEVSDDTPPCGPPPRTNLNEHPAPPSPVTEGEFIHEEQVDHDPLPGMDEVAVQFGSMGMEDVATPL